ncbi:RNA-directed RNA polymerase [ssRNA phage SRR5467091_13]|uniref:RNA-directed RNA polymerase n=1 Tax=ssRNA phage SRR5467091_13 TaxID=2786463 RepID=A0A8S5L493_9VIRU|nr:RNA-directed RNA polymerase [ssRNA phage SRR5467091_13]DAD52512.1 TPA_asm: RNA-directed RNA polymerase [ssRNA phage SRR5467091_13]
MTNKPSAGRQNPENGGVIRPNRKGLTEWQVRVLEEIWKDFPQNRPWSRRVLDAAYRLIRDATLETLYDDYRALSESLARGDLSCTSVSFPVLNPIPLVDHSVVKWYRQVTGIFTRVRGNPDTQDILASYAQRVRTSNASIPRPWREVAAVFVRQWLGRCPDHMVLKGAHGPGAVAERVKPVDKSATVGSLPPHASAFAGMLALNDHMVADGLPRLSYDPRLFARVILVPKDFRRKRVISAEPMLLQYMQHGVSAYMMDRLEFRAETPIRFTDQQTNATVCKSLDLATIDMSDASDLVSRKVVHQLFDEDWRTLLFGLRSRCSIMPDGTIVPLRAFAPMGSALCFPVESIVFASVVVAIIATSQAPYTTFLRRGVHSEEYSRATEGVYVYGDDIIVPKHVAHLVVEGLELCGFKPNRAKTCIDGLFRESCGAEYFNGFDVAPVRPKEFGFTRSSRDERIPPMVDIANRLHKAGFLRAARFVAASVPFPVAVGLRPGYGHPALPWRNLGRVRYNTKLQRYEQQALVLVDRARSVEHDGWDGLMGWFHHRGRSQRAGSPRLTAKRAWRGIDQPRVVDE